MNRVTIRRFDVVRTANVVAVLYAVGVLVIGLVVVVPFTLLTVVAGVSSSGSEMAGIVGASIVGGLVLGLIAVVFYGIMGWIMTAIGCALYNWVAGRIGGFRVEVEVEGPYPGRPGYPTPYGAPGYGNPAWPVPGSPAGQPAPPPPGWGQPGG